MSELLISNKGTANDLKISNVVIPRNSICDSQETTDIEYIVAEVDPGFVSNFHEDNPLYEEDCITFSKAFTTDETPYPVYLVKSSNFENTESSIQEDSHLANEIAILPDSYQLLSSLDYLENDAVNTTSETSATFPDNSREGILRFCLESSPQKYQDTSSSISNIVNDRKKKSKVGRSLLQRDRSRESKNRFHATNKDAHLIPNQTYFSDSYLTIQGKNTFKRPSKRVSKNKKEILIPSEDNTTCYKDEILISINKEGSIPKETEELPSKIRTSISSLLSKNTSLFDVHKCMSSSKSNRNSLYKRYSPLRAPERILSRKTKGLGNLQLTSNTHSVVKTHPQLNKNDLLSFDLKDAIISDSLELKLSKKPKKSSRRLCLHKPRKDLKSTSNDISSEKMALSNSATYSIEDRERSEGGLYTEVTEQLQYINMLCAQIQEAEQKRPISRTVKEQETNISHNSVTTGLQLKNKDKDKKDFKIRQDLLLGERKLSMPILKLRDIQEVIGPISQDQTIKVSDYFKKIKTKCKQTVQNIDKSCVLSYERSEFKKKTNINHVNQKDGSDSSIATPLISDHKINRGPEPINIAVRNGQNIRSLRKRSHDSTESKISIDEKSQVNDRNIKKLKSSRSLSDSELIETMSTNNSIKTSTLLTLIGKSGVHSDANLDSKCKKKISMNDMPMLHDETVADKAENSRTRLRNKVQKMPKLVQEKLAAEKISKLKQNKVGELQQNTNIELSNSLRELACTSSDKNLHYTYNSKKLLRKTSRKVKSNKTNCVVDGQKTSKTNEVTNLEKRPSLPKQSNRDLEYQMMDTPTLVKLRSRVQSPPKTGAMTSPLKSSVRKEISKEIFNKYKKPLDDDKVSLCIKSGNSIKKQNTDQKIDTLKNVACKINTEVKDIKVVLRRLDESIKIMPSTTESKDEIQLKNVLSSATPQLRQRNCCICSKQDRSSVPNNTKVKRSKSLPISLSSRMESLKNQIKEVSEILQKSNKKRLISNRKCSKNSEALKEACNELTELLNCTFDLRTQKTVTSEYTSNSIFVPAEAVEIPDYISEEIVIEDCEPSNADSVLIALNENISDAIDNKELNKNCNFDSENSPELLHQFKKDQSSDDENVAEIIQEVLTSLLNQLQSSDIKNFISQPSDKERQNTTIENPIEELQIENTNNQIGWQSENLEEHESKLITNAILSTERNEDQVNEKMYQLYIKSENEHNVTGDSVTDLIASVLDEVSCVDDKDLCKASLEKVSDVEDVPGEPDDLTEEINNLTEEIDDFTMKKHSDCSDDFLPDSEFLVLDSWQNEESDFSKDKTNYCNGGLLSEISNFEDLQAVEIIEEKEEIIRELLTALINKI